MDRAHRAIKRYWTKMRLSSTRNLAAKFAEHGPSDLNIRSKKSFEKLLLFLQEKEVLHITRACLQRLHLRCTVLHPAVVQTSMLKSINVREFLAAFLLVHWKSKMFDNFDDLEASVYDAAVAMTDGLHALVAAVNDGKPMYKEPIREISRKFLEDLLRYFKCFGEWRTRELQMSTSRLEHALDVLYRSRAALSKTEYVSSALYKDIETQLERFREKYAKTVGEESLKKLDDKFPSPHVVPSSATNVMSAFCRLDNEQLAHELLLNSSFQFGESDIHSENPVFREVQAIFEKEIWGSLADDLLRHRHPTYVQTMLVIVEIKDSINTIRPDSLPINIEHIRQQIHRKAFSLQDAVSLLTSIMTVMLTLQTASRREKVAPQWLAIRLGLGAADQSNDDFARRYCDALRFVFNTLHAMRVDDANKRVRHMSPVIVVHGVEYAREKFVEKLRDGHLTVANTQRWVNKAVDQTVAHGVALQSLASNVCFEHYQLHARAMIDLVCSQEVPSLSHFPETLLFDLRRFVYLHGCFREMLNDAVVILVLKQCFGLKEVPKAILDLASNFSLRIDVVVDIIAVETKSIDFAASVRAQLEKNVEPCSPIYQNTVSVMQQFWYLKLSGEDVVLSEPLRCLLTRLDKAVAILDQVLVCFRRVHGAFVNGMITDRARELGNT